MKISSAIIRVSATESIQVNTVIENNENSLLIGWGKLPAGKYFSGSLPIRIN